MPWLKGNTHAHTSESDGDAPLAEVAGWYESHGYDFLVITDHNRVVDVSRWKGSDRLLLVRGCEVSLTSEGKPVHVCSLGSARLPDLSTAGTIPAALQRAVDAVRAAGGVPQVNHPNYKWALTDAQLRRISVDNAQSHRQRGFGRMRGNPGHHPSWRTLHAAADGRTAYAFSHEHRR